MKYYIVLLLSFFLVTLLFSRKNRDVKTDKKYLITCFIILTLFLAFRGEDVGLDMGNYQYFFGGATRFRFFRLTRFSGFENGFVFYIRLVAIISKSFHDFIFITSILSMLGFFFFIKDNSKNYFASLLLFITFGFYICHFCILRQVLAMSILLFSYKYVKEEKFWKFTLLVLIAATFHKTSIVFFPVYFLSKIPYNKKIIYIYLISMLLLFILRVPLINLATTILYGQYEGYKDTSGSGYVMLGLIYAVVLGIMLVFKNYKLEDRESKILFYMLLLSIPFQILATVQGLLARIVMYFTCSLMILIPNAIETKNLKERKFLIICYTIALVIYFLIELSRNSMYVPYSIF